MITGGKRRLCGAVERAGIEGFGSGPGGSSELLSHTGRAPERITTDKLASYAAAKQRVPELDGVEHQQVRSSMRCNNRVEQAHQPTRIRERRMGRFRCPASTQRFLTAFAHISNLFRPRRHLLSASEYRTILQDRFATWREVATLMVA